MSGNQNNNRFRAWLVQMCSGRDVAHNTHEAVRLIAEAARQGADYIQTPEVTTLMEHEPGRIFAAARPEEGNTSLQAFVNAARHHNIWLHIGSMPVKVDETRLANRAYLISPRGDIAARYDKIHMFDVDLGNGEVYSESASYRAGEKAVLAELPWGMLGITICYDLRFPALHRALAKSGASFIAGPAAFTKITGEAHWHTLLKARAIEAQSFIFAAAQVGLHENGRETFGHSLIISPWGQILADGGDQPGVVTADIDTHILDDVRMRLPSLTHDRPFEVEKVSTAATTQRTPSATGA